MTGYYALDGEQKGPVERVIEQTPQVKCRTSIVIWILLGLVLLLVLTALLFTVVGHRH